MDEELKERLLQYLKHADYWIGVGDIEQADVGIQGALSLLEGKEPEPIADSYKIKPAE